jgi:hypothetical protein
MPLLFGHQTLYILPGARQNAFMLFKQAHTLNAVESRKNIPSLLIRRFSDKKYCNSNTVNGNDRFAVLRKFSWLGKRGKYAL